MSRFYVSRENVRGSEIVVTGSDAHHVLTVLRLQKGDKITVFDGTGNEYIGLIQLVDAKKERLVASVLETRKIIKERMPEIVLAQAIPKKSRMDYIVEKATELGVARIVPLITARTIVRANDAHSITMAQRWGKIAIEASKQCNRSTIPVIERITKFNDMVNRIHEYDLALLAHLEDKTIPLKESLQGFRSGKILVFIGPEGDFTSKEVGMADREDCRFITLGSRVLKSDTAGLFVLSVLNYEFNPGLNKLC